MVQYYYAYSGLSTPGTIIFYFSPKPAWRLDFMARRAVKSEAMTGQKVLASSRELAILQMIAARIYDAGRTPTAFGRDLGIAKNHMSAILNGYQHVNVDQLDRMLGGMAVDLVELVGRSLKKPSPVGSGRTNFPRTRKKRRVGFVTRIS
jgi:hypothetical protein